MAGVENVIVLFVVIRINRSQLAPVWNKYCIRRFMCYTYILFVRNATLVATVTGSVVDLKTNRISNIQNNNYNNNNNPLPMIFALLLNELL